MKFYTLILIFFLSFKTYSQNPEFGIFWAAKFQILEMDTVKKTMKSGMGWTLIQTGSTAFKFTKEEVTIYEGGVLADNYKKITHLKVLKRYLEFDTLNNFANYTYETMLTATHPMRIFAQIKNEEDYGIANITVYDDYRNNMYNSITIYQCGRVVD